MDTDKINAFNEQQAISLEERAKTEDTAFALKSILDSQKGIEDSVKKSILQLVKFLSKNQPKVSVTNQQPYPKYDEVVKAIGNVVTEVKNSNKKLDTVEQKEADFSPITNSLDKLSKLVAKLPTNFPETKIPEAIDYSSKFDEVKEAVTSIPAPIVNVEKPVIPDNSKELDKLLKAVEKIKFPDIPKTDLEPLLKATKKVGDTISGLRFPVPNYVLPFKDADGKAVQVQLDASGNIPTSGGGGSGGAVAGDVAHDAVDSGNPVKIGGKATSSVPTAVSSADRTDAWFDQWGRQVVSDQDVELGLTIGATSLRDRLTVQRYTVKADSIADGLASFWTTTTANGGTAAVTTGEGAISTSANATGSAQISSTSTRYFPGQEAWLNSAIRFGDTGSAGNIRRVGLFTVSGTAPQDGFYFELNDTTLNAVIMKAGSVVSSIASTSWSRVTDAPFTIDTNYHQFELRFTANRVRFYIDNSLRHSVTDPSSAITSTLNFPITISSINTSGATNRQIFVRNIGVGAFGEPAQPVDETGVNATRAIGVGGGTPHDSVDSGNPLKIGGYASSSAPNLVSAGDRVNAWFTRAGAQVIALTDGTNYALLNAQASQMVKDQDYATRIDEASATVTYIGAAVPGTATSAASWQIKKIDSSSGTAITYADSNSNFDNVWDNRASLTYS